MASFTDGWTANSIVGGGNGGGKFVALKLIVGVDTLAAGMAVALTDGRIGRIFPGPFRDAAAAVGIGAIGSYFLPCRFSYGYFRRYYIRRVSEVACGVAAARFRAPSILIRPAPMSMIARAPRRYKRGQLGRPTAAGWIKSSQLRAMSDQDGHDEVHDDHQPTQSREQANEDQNWSQHFTQVNAIRQERRRAISLDPCRDAIDAVHDFVHAVEKQQPADREAQDQLAQIVAPTSFTWFHELPPFDF